jgi:hypothetical protein
MGLLRWLRKRRQEREREAEQLDEMRRADEPDEPGPAETYLSQMRDSRSHRESLRPKDARPGEWALSSGCRDSS